MDINNKYLSLKNNNKTYKHNLIRINQQHLCWNRNLKAIIAMWQCFKCVGFNFCNFYVIKRVVFTQSMLYLLLWSLCTFISHNLYQNSGRNKDILNSNWRTLSNFILFCLVSIPCYNVEVIVKVLEIRFTESHLFFS